MYKALAKEEELCISLARRYKPGPNPAPLSHAQLWEYYKGKEAITKTNHLFAQHGIPRDHPDWKPGGSQYTQYRKRASFHACHDLQTQIIHCITERAMEMAVLQRRMGQHAAKKFLQAVNGHWKALSKLVSDYNTEARKYNRSARLEQPFRDLNADNLRANGLDNGEI
jgi:hypothetical protein